jgi:carbonic anhydrase/acetyltransferase-like protein (isoleucine patch superfamily)
MDNKTLWETNEDVVILAGGRVSGKVTMGRGCSVWYNAVIRGDEASITIGENTNIQDCAVLHTSDGHPLTVGNGVTVGHSAILHSCTVGDNTLIGMGAIVLDDAVVGSNCIIGAGALVTKGTVVPDGSLFLGRPARLKRMLFLTEIEGNRENAAAYCRRREEYR